VSAALPRSPRVFLAACAALVIGASSAYAYWALVLDHFVEIDPGQVYRSGAMPPERLLATVREYGIRSVIDLRTHEEEAERERALLATAGVRHFHIPSQQVPDAKTIDAFLAVMEDPANRPVLIHCTHGVGRAPLYEAIYRIEFEGWSPERARESAYWRSGLGAFEPDDRKGRFLRAYTPRRHADVASRPPP
jgi:protein tyrosine phosphatase (PTP) superfamily phosphohydrolase (DUF442 family)